MTDLLLTELERIQGETGLSDHRIGILAVNNGRLLERLRSGGRVWPETESKIRKYIAANPAPTAPADSEAAS